jgi:hypothetical protein
MDTADISAATLAWAHRLEGVGDNVGARFAYQKVIGWGHPEYSPRVADQLANVDGNQSQTVLSGSHPGRVGTQAVAKPRVLRPRYGDRWLMLLLIGLGAIWLWFGFELLLDSTSSNKFSLVEMWLAMGSAVLVSIWAIRMLLCIKLRKHDLVVRNLLRFRVIDYSDLAGVTCGSGTWDALLGMGTVAATDYLGAADPGRHQ